MLTILFILLVAAANLGIGFAGAVYLGLGPKQWPPKHQPEEEEIVEPIVEEVIEEVIEEEEDEETPPPAAPEVAFPEIDAQQQPLVALVQQLSRGFDHFEAELAEWDSHRRESAADEESLANASVELHGLTTAYVSHFQAAIEPLATLEPTTPEIGAARNTVSAAISELAAQLKQVSGDLQPTGDKLTTALIQVLAVLHAARDKMQEPLIELLAEQLDDPGLLALAKQSPCATLLGRIAFEHAWRGGEKSCAAMIDVDSMRQLNAAHGPQFAGRTLAALGDLAREILPAGSSVARLSGKRFLLWLPTLDTATAVSAVETLRQEVEQARLRRGSKQLQITVSAAVLAIGSERHSVAALDHLRSAIGEAKAHGRNRTFVWESSGSTAAEPPKLSIQARTVNL